MWSPCLALELTSGALHSNRGASQIDIQNGSLEALKNPTKKPGILSFLHFDSVSKHRYWEGEGEGKEGGREEL